jgi:hypothetical protein
MQQVFKAKGPELKVVTTEAAYNQMLESAVVPSSFVIEMANADGDVGPGARVAGGGGGPVVPAPSTSRCVVGADVNDLASFSHGLAGTLDLSNRSNSKQTTGDHSSAPLVEEWIMAMSASFGPYFYVPASHAYGGKTMYFEGEELTYRFVHTEFLALLKKAERVTLDKFNAAVSAVEKPAVRLHSEDAGFLKKSLKNGQTFKQDPIFNIFNKCICLQKAVHSS